MHFSIDPSLSKLCPSLSTAWVRIVLAADAKADREALDKLKVSALASLLEDRCPSGQLAELESIKSISDWLAVYKRMGLRPKKVKPTHYALASRLLKDQKWPRPIGPLVDTYLANQIKHILPHGGFDVSSLSGELIRLTVSREEYTFQKLGVQADDVANLERTRSGEVVYLDCASAGTTCLTRYLNHRDAEPTKIVDEAEDESKSTRDFVLIIESLDGSVEGKKELWRTATDLEDAYRTVYRGGLLQSYVRVVDMDEAKEATLALDL